MSAAVEYVAVGAPAEFNGSVGNASAGPDITSGASGFNGGVWVYGGWPLEFVAHVRAPVAASDQGFGWSLSFGGGGVLAIGSAGSCILHVVDVW